MGMDQALKAVVLIPNFGSIPVISAAPLCDFILEGSGILLIKQKQDSAMNALLKCSSFYGVEYVYE